MQKSSPGDNKKKIIIGGSIGLAICFVLFLFYNLAYFPALEKKYGDTQPQWTIIPPTLTGHMLPYISHFIIEGSPAVSLFCQATDPVCTNWGVNQTSFCKDPWAMDGIVGCCNEKILVPNSNCSDKVDFVFFIIISTLLSGLYFIIGSLISWKIFHRKK